MTTHNPWLEHVAKVKKKNMNLAYKDVLKLAKISYKGGSSTTSKQNGGSINKKIIKGGKNNISKKQNGGTIKKKIIKGGKNDIAKKQNGGTIKKNLWLLHVANIKKKNKNLAYKDVLILAKKSYKGGSVKKNKKGGEPNAPITFKYPDWLNGKVSKLLQDAMKEIKNNKLYNLFFDNILTTTMGANSLSARNDKTFEGNWKDLINGAYNNYLKLCCKDNQPIISDVLKDKNFKIAHGGIIPILDDNKKNIKNGLYGAVGHTPIGALPYIVRGILNCDTTYSGSLNDRPDARPDAKKRLPLTVKVSFEDNDNWCITVKTQLFKDGKPINEKLVPIFSEYLIKEDSSELKTILKYKISSEFFKYVGQNETYISNEYKKQFIIGYIETETEGNKFIITGTPGIVNTNRKIKPYTIEYKVEKLKKNNNNRSTFLKQNDLDYTNINNSPYQDFYLFADIEGNLNWLENSINLIPENERKSLYCFLGDTWDRGSIDEENEIYNIIDDKYYKGMAKVVLGNRDVNKTRIIESYCDEISMLEEYVKVGNINEYFKMDTIEYINNRQTPKFKKNGRIIAGLGTDEAKYLLKEEFIPDGFNENKLSNLLKYINQGPLQSRTEFQGPNLKLMTFHDVKNCFRFNCNKCRLINEETKPLDKDLLKKFYKKLNEKVSNIINNYSIPNRGVNNRPITFNDARKIFTQPI